MKLIDRLFSGPIDIVGDIHGEIEALQNLMRNLGFDESGIHPQGRRLVFLGDLVDRGPDSPAVINLVSQLVETGRAQCILGNHELNLLLDKKRPGNEWFMDPVSTPSAPFIVVPEDQKDAVIAFLSTLPIALQNEDLRVVHACWHFASISKLDNSVEKLNVSETFRKFEVGLQPTFTHPVMTRKELNGVLKNLDIEPAFIPELAKHDADYQMANPVRVLTSGSESPTQKPFKAGGKWRMVERQKWWDEYSDPVPVIVGHYWRRFGDLSFEKNGKEGPDLFEGIEHHHWMGKRKNVYCVDFSVGRRYEARSRGWDEGHFKLAAFRWPEGRVMHDDGRYFDVI